MTAINTTSLAASLTGSTFDWQSFVDQIIQIDSAPITTLQSQQATNSNKVSALDVLKTDLTDLQTATTALNAADLFTGRTASSATAGSTWALTAASGATTGSYAINVTQLATTSQRNGASNIGAAISTSDITKDTVGSGTTLASLPTATAVTAGTFTINGTQITVGLTDSLEDVFKNIYTATGGTVTASYDHTTDKVSLNSSSEIVLGATNDSSNLLSALQLANNGSGTITSSGNSLGAVNTTTTLANSRLSQAITAVDSSGNGSFTVNGTNIAYNINTDSMADVIKRINASSAGVTASYDTANDRLILANNSTGDMGFGLSETAGGFLDATGLSMTSLGATTNRGKNAQFTVNGGATVASASNTLSSAATGITGLTVQATSTGNQTVTVAANTSAMQTAIQGFIDKYNIVQSYIDLQTTSTVSNGSVSTSTLTDTREVDGWASALRSQTFAAVSGLSGTVSRLADLGIDFSGTSNQLNIRDNTKLTNALTKNPNDVAAFFNTASTGFAATMNTYLNTLVDTNGTGSNGALTSIENTLTSQNSSMDAQISAIQRQLVTEKDTLTAGFQAMQAAQAQAKSMITLLQSTFSSSTTTSSG